MTDGDGDGDGQATRDSWTGPSRLRARLELTKAMNELLVQQNKELIETVRQLTVQVWEYRWLIAHLQNLLAQAFKEHESFMKGVGKRDR